MNPSLLRLIDANANRAREALRVVEDYARFILNADNLCGELKAIRHALADTLAPLLADAILHRDTPGDVGTTIKTAGEFHREDLADVVTAGGKRLGEALRAIEEYLKIIAPIDASKIESLRYRFYDVEQKLARTLRPANRFDPVRLYVLITESACRGDWFTTADAAIRGGADCLQLREKDLDSGELLRRAIKMVTLCRQYQVISIINDRPDIALLSGADGVHVGQFDLPATEVRKLIGREKIVGVSTHEMGQARQAMLDGADYIGVGPIFRSPTKPRDFVAGLEYARDVAANIHIPAVAIAGITEANIDQVLGTGMTRIAVTAAVVGCEDVFAAVLRMKEHINHRADNPQRHRDTEIDGRT